MMRLLLPVVVLWSCWSPGCAVMTGEIVVAITMDDARGRETRWVWRLEEEKRS